MINNISELSTALVFLCIVRFNERNAVVQFHVNYFQSETKNMTRAGFEPATTETPVRGSTKLAIQPVGGGRPNSHYFVSAVLVRSHNRGLQLFSINLS